LRPSKAEWRRWRGVCSAWKRRSSIGPSQCRRPPGTRRDRRRAIPPRPLGNARAESPVAVDRGGSLAMKATGGGGRGGPCHAGALSPLPTPLAGGGSAAPAAAGDRHPARAADRHRVSAASLGLSGVWRSPSGRWVTVFVVRRSRSAKVAQELLGERFCGWLVTDHWRAYTWYPSWRRQRGSQILRGGSLEPRGLSRSPTKCSASKRSIQAVTVGRDTFRKRLMLRFSQP
jgi:hypothetical protein